MMSIKMQSGMRRCSVHGGRHCYGAKISPVDKTEITNKNWASEWCQLENSQRNTDRRVLKNYRTRSVRTLCMYSKLKSAKKNLCRSEDGKTHTYLLIFIVFKSAQFFFGWLQFRLQYCKHVRIVPISFNNLSKRADPYSFVNLQIDTIPRHRFSLVISVLSTGEFFAP